MGKLSARTPRLFIAEKLATGAELAPTREQSHYLINVMRLKPGQTVLVFNGQDGEWRSQISTIERKNCRLLCEHQLAAAAPLPDIDYLFAPLKHARLDYLVQKATEMGVRRLRPVLTAHTVASRVNLERMRANVIEAAEQCNLTAMPEVLAEIKLPALLEGWDAARRLIYCDEKAAAANPADILQRLQPGPLAVLIGPEGGFSDNETQLLRAQTYVTALSLGPRIMRADTAGVAALALIQTFLGDWRE